MQILGKKKFFSIVEQSQILSNLGFEIAFSSYIKNPLREDTKPNCRLVLEGNKIIFIDYGSNIYGDCVSLYRKWKSVSRQKAIEDLNKILENSEIPVPEIIETKEKNNIPINIQYNSSKEKDLYSYFYDYFITYETLQQYKVLVGILVLVKQKIIETFRHTEKEPCFLYLTSEGIKMYRPNSVKKWRTTSSFIQGIEQLDKRRSYDFIIITKSLKDVMVLHELGFPAISCGSETTKVNIDYLNRIFKCREFIILYDNDKAGIKAAQEFTEQRHIFIPAETGKKDISDYIKEFGIDNSKILINNLLCAH